MSKHDQTIKSAWNQPHYTVNHKSQLYLFCGCGKSNFFHHDGKTTQRLLTPGLISLPPLRPRSCLPVCTNLSTLVDTCMARLPDPRCLLYIHDSVIPVQSVWLLPKSCPSELTVISLRISSQQRVPSVSAHLFLPSGHEIFTGHCCRLNSDPKLVEALTTQYLRMGPRLEIGPLRYN